MKNRSRILTLGAILAGLAAFYCFSGYAMNASFAGASEGNGHRTAALLWGAAGLTSLAVAVGLSATAWRSRRSSDHS